MSAASQREPHIDGLRSLAIVPVVLFHAGFSILPGGFVGVDVFFVISGYLITRILAGEIDQRSFSLWRFYERRARRIMPALFVVVATSAVFALLWFTPDDLVRFANSGLYALLFASNIYFFLTSGYFDAAAESYALLHTWSLAVEEQFYLVFPLVLWALARAPHWIRLATVASIGAASLAYCVVTTPSDPTFAFYLPITRAWELMTGSLLALGAAPRLNVPAVRETAAALGLAAVLAAVFLLSEGDAFPGWVALVPVLGAAALIQYAPGTATGWLLSRLPLVGIGLISYSLYLWHWPILVFAEDYLMRSLRPLEATGLVVLALVLSILTWRFVEQPFRNRQFLSRGVVLGGTAAGIVAGAVFCVALVLNQGLPERLPPEATRLAAFADDVSPKRSACHDDPQSPVSIKNSCALGADVPPTLAIWGDSHGVEYAYALGERAEKSGKSVLQLTSSGCSPSLDYSPTSRPKCASRNRAVVDYLLSEPTIDTVIIAASRAATSDRLSSTRRILNGLDKAVGELEAAGKRVVLVSPVPRDTTTTPTRLALEYWRRGSFDPVLTSLSSFNKGLTRTLGRLDDLAAMYSLTIVRPTDVLCSDGQCLAYLDGKVMLFDRHHPSLSAARMVAPLFKDIIAASGR